MRIIYGLLGMVVGFLVIRYSIKLTEWFGNIDFAERYLRGGLAGTITMYRIAGVFFIVFSFLYMFGGLGTILSPLAPLFGAIK